MSVTVLKKEQHKRIYPAKFTLWVGIASIIMMFAGLTSAFIVKSNLTGWRTIVMPKIFWVSTAVVIASSVTLHLAIGAFKNREMQKYRALWGTTAVLGITFIILQIVGFTELWAQNVKFRGSSGAGQFFYAIAGLHGLHVIGGIVALVIMLMRSIWGKTKYYSVAPLETMAVYWHFVDALWIYLMIFFLIVG